MIDLNLDEEQLLLALQKAGENLVNYRKLLLTVSPDDCESPWFHYAWSDILLYATDNYAIEGYRESGKSQIVLRAFPMYCLTFPAEERDYIVLIKNNVTLARNKLKEIEREFFSNEIASTKLKKVIEQSGDAFHVELYGLTEGTTIDIRIEAYGKGSSIRGLSYGDKRPKICIVDDPQDFEDAESVTVQETDWNWFLSDIWFLGQKTRIFLIGNNLGDRSIIERCIAQSNKLNFQTMRVPVMDANDEPTWSAKNTAEEINKEKQDFLDLGKIDIWMREKMCQSVAKETQVFHKEDYRYYVPTIMRSLVRDCNVYAAIDLAISKKLTADFSAIAVVGVDEKNQWFLLDFPYGRWNPSEQIDQIFNVVLKWQPMKFGIEKVAYQAALEHFVRQEMSKRNCFFNIEELKADKKKEIRIDYNLGPRFKAHSIYFPENAPFLLELETELNMFTVDGSKSLHDDLIDALSYIGQLAQKPMKGINQNNGHRQLQRQTNIETTVC